jgi:hypothetical protein
MKITPQSGHGEYRRLTALTGLDIPAKRDVSC